MAAECGDSGDHLGSSAWVSRSLETWGLRPSQPGQSRGQRLTLQAGAGWELRTRVGGTGEGGCCELFHQEAPSSVLPEKRPVGPWVGVS